MDTPGISYRGIGTRRCASPARSAEGIPTMLCICLPPKRRIENEKKM